VCFAWLRTQSSPPYKATSGCSTLRPTAAKYLGTSMDFTYGEELPLDAVAPLFAASAARASSNVASTSAPNTLLSRNLSHSNTSSRKILHSNSVNNEDDEMEEGEVLEDGEISESSSDEAEFVAASLIAPTSRVSKSDYAETSQSLPREWIQRLQSQRPSSIALPPVSSSFTGPAHHQAVAGPSNTSHCTFVFYRNFSTA